MKFSEFDLYRAIYQIRQSANGLTADPTIASEREEVYRAIHAQLPPDTTFSVDECCRGWVNYRKRAGNAFIVEVAMTHGCVCFWANRGKGSCDQTVTVDRLVPGSRGGEYRIENCVIACRRHNSRRQDMAIEEWLRPQDSHALFDAR